MIQKRSCSSSVAESFTTPDLLVLTRYHAACMAAASIRAKIMCLSCSPSSSSSSSSSISSSISANDLVRYSTQLCQLESIASSAMASYINILSKMDNDGDKVASLFKSPRSFEVVDLNMLEKALLGTTGADNGNGCNALPPLPQDMVNKSQIVLQLSRSDDDAIADESTATMTATERAKRTLHNFVECLAEALGPSSSFDDALSLIALRVLGHCKSGGTAALLSEENGHMSSNTKLDLIDDERALILFRLIDADASGCISFEEISNSLLHLMKDGMDPNLKQIWAVLLLSGKDDKRKLEYNHFSDLLLNAIAASKGTVDFDDICADLTISHCQHEEYAGGEGGEPFSLSENFRDDALKEILEEMRAVEQTDEEIVSVIQYKKMHKLFDLWDTDHSGTIDFSEFTIQLRKFQTTTAAAGEDVSLDTTVNHAIEVMLAIDDSTDQAISRQEFATFCVKFAKAAQIDLFELIDFMLVRTILRDDSEADLAYLDKVKNRAHKRMTWMAPPSLAYNPDKWGG